MDFSFDYGYSCGDSYDLALAAERAAAIAEREREWTMSLGLSLLRPPPLSSALQPGQKRSRSSNIAADECAHTPTSAYSAASTALISPFGNTEEECVDSLAPHAVSALRVSTPRVGPYSHRLPSFAIAIAADVDTVEQPPVPISPKSKGRLPPKKPLAANSKAFTVSSLTSSSWDFSRTPHYSTSKVHHSEICFVATRAQGSAVPIFLRRSILRNPGVLFANRLFRAHLFAVSLHRAVRIAAEKAGVGSYVRRDAASRKSLTPGQAHPTLLERIRAVTLLGPGDVFVDIGHGDGCAILALASITGAAGYGVEVVGSRQASAERVWGHFLEELQSSESLQAATKAFAEERESADGPEPRRIIGNPDFLCNVAAKSAWPAAEARADADRAAAAPSGSQSSICCLAGAASALRGHLPQRGCEPPAHENMCALRSAGELRHAELRVREPPVAAVHRSRGAHLDSTVSGLVPLSPFFSSVSEGTAAAPREPPDADFLFAASISASAADLDMSGAHDGPGERRRRAAARQRRVRNLIGSRLDSSTWLGRALLAPACAQAAPAATRRVAAAPASAAHAAALPINARVALEWGDARQVFAQSSSALHHARVVYCNNFDGVWADGGLQEEISRLLARVLPRGSIVVACTAFSGRRFSDAERAPPGGGPPLDDRPLLREAPCNGRGDIFYYANLYVEIAGGWPQGLPGDDWDTATPARRLELLRDNKFDHAVAHSWLSGRHTKQYDAVKYLIESKIAACASSS